MSEEETRFYLEKRRGAPKGWVLKVLSGGEREPSWEEIVLWMSVSNLAARVQELEGDQ